jgi:hypothetical protein
MSSSNERSVLTSAELIPSSALLLKDVYLESLLAHFHIDFFTAFQTTHQIGIDATHNIHSVAPLAPSFLTHNKLSVTFLEINSVHSSMYVRVFHTTHSSHQVSSTTH